jgi:hypothetical protein
MEAEGSGRKREREDEGAKEQLESAPLPTPKVERPSPLMRQQEVMVSRVAHVAARAVAPGLWNGRLASAHDPLAAPPSARGLAQEKERTGELRFDTITNDGKDETMVHLITLKNIFAKQLPKMPKEYIVRLVLDRCAHPQRPHQRARTRGRTSALAPAAAPPSHPGEMADRAPLPPLRR